MFLWLYQPCSSKGSVLSFAGLDSGFLYVVNVLVEKFRRSYQIFGSRWHSHHGILARNTADSTRAPCCLLLFYKDPPTLFDYSRSRD